MNGKLLCGIGESISTYQSHSSAERDIITVNLLTIKHFEWFESNGKILFKTHQSNRTIRMV